MIFILIHIVTSSIDGLSEFLECFFSGRYAGMLREVSFKFQLRVKGCDGLRNFNVALFLPSVLFVLGVGPFCCCRNNGKVATICYHMHLLVPGKIVRMDTGYFLLVVIAVMELVLTFHWSFFRNFNLYHR